MKKVTIILEQFGEIEVNAMILDPNYRENYGYVKAIEPIAEKPIIQPSESKTIRKAKRITDPKPSTKHKDMRTNFDKKEAVNRTASKKDRIFKTIPVNTSEMIAVKIDSKTTVYAKNQADVERLKLKYANKK